ncbi:M48 family metallopeptidase [Pseudoramibacter sp.]|jgi:predicted metal-dependent hydrolase|uniref:M48 family metallopeptidase n=1 Tax=Pseudoramibacter sp. TaxID=2034862 RepID=UPI0025D5E932|nr:SprT family zinc-dependent metalloprotease [Pseudoramibacter sp.]MCH4072649.1 M48 family metallopeptidase [Pseudoramibacter sp.]MCH4106420.1 M48 family metallopeptidase [Pseudoramibacter sp.]
MQAYQLIRSRRKTIAVQVKKDGTVEVKAPNTMAQSDIDRFVEEKSEWISKRKQQAELARNFEIKDGSWITVFGVEIPVLAVPDGQFEFKRAVKLDHSLMTIPEEADQNTIKREIIKIYKDLAEEIIFQRVAWYEQRMQLYPSKVRISNASRRWGSCSSKKSINFSWKLAMADGKAIDSVVVHELCHLRYMNHSKSFWQLVAQYCPDYQEQRAKLNQLSEKLLSENWEL